MQGETTMEYQFWEPELTTKIQSPNQDPPTFVPNQEPLPEMPIPTISPNPDNPAGHTDSSQRLEGSKGSSPKKDIIQYSRRKKTNIEPPT